MRRSAQSAANRPVPPRLGGPGRCGEDSGDNRLSRQGHYHGPDGLNGRVRNGNGCDPAGMVAGKAPGGRSGRAGCRFQLVVRSRSQDHSARGRGALFLHRVDPHGRGPLARGVGWGTGHCFTAIRSPLPGKGRGGRIGVVKHSAVGTGPLRRSPAVHSQPIDLVVFQEPSHIKCWKPRLEEGFALRCLQRLSFPDLATRRCPERDSRYTRGRSSPILSY